MIYLLCLPQWEVLILNRFYSAWIVSPVSILMMLQSTARPRINRKYRSKTISHRISRSLDFVVRLSGQNFRWFLYWLPDWWIRIHVTYDLFNNEFRFDRFEFDISLDLVFIYKHLTNCTKETVFNKWLLTFKSAKRQNNRVVLIVRYRTRQHNGI